MIHICYDNSMTCNRSLYPVRLKTLMSRSPNMDSLIAVGTSAAVLYSAYNTDVVGQQSVASFDEVLKNIPDKVSADGPAVP